MFNKKCVFKSFSKLAGRHLCWSLFFIKVAGVLKKLRQRSFFLSIIRNFWANLIYRTLPGGSFWIGLMIRKFNPVSIIVLNSHIYHGSPEWSITGQGCRKLFYGGWVQMLATMADRERKIKKPLAKTS